MRFDKKITEIMSIEAANYYIDEGDVSDEVYYSYK
jgi:hypothetical protein